jgi:hypothetical protein
VVVDGFVEGTDAAFHCAAGRLQVGDALVAVGGEDVVGIPFGEVTKRFKHGWKELNITVARSKVVVEFVKRATGRLHPELNPELKKGHTDGKAETRGMKLDAPVFDEEAFKEEYGEGRAYKEEYGEGRAYKEEYGEGRLGAQLEDAVKEEEKEKAKEDEQLDEQEIENAFEAVFAAAEDGDDDDDDDEDGRRAREEALRRERAMPIPMEEADRLALEAAARIAAEEGGQFEGLGGPHDPLGGHHWGEDLIYYLHMLLLIGSFLAVLVAFIVDELAEVYPGLEKWREYIEMFELI